MLLLATDLDGTFLAGQAGDKEKLYQLIRQRPDIKLVFVTGRGLGTVLPVLNDVAIPKPDYIICDVGATIVNGIDLQPIQPLQSAIEEKWGGSVFIYDQLKEVKGLSLQDVPQSRRCSFFYNKETDFSHLYQVANNINCDVIKSAGRFVDVLPHGVSKGYSLQQLTNLLHISPQDILVAGDTMNDLSLYEVGYKGVVVGEAETDLLEATTGMSHVYQANSPGCGGILEAFNYFRIFAH